MPIPMPMLHKICTNMVTAAGVEVVGAALAALPKEVNSQSKTVRFDASLNRTYVIPRKTESSWNSWSHNLGGGPVETRQQINWEMTSKILDSFGENDEPFDCHFANVDDGDFANDENDENRLMDLLDSIAAVPSFVEDAERGGDTASIHKRKASDTESDGTAFKLRRKQLRVASVPVAQTLAGLEVRRPLTEIACL